MQGKPSQRNNENTKPADDMPKYKGMTNREIESLLGRQYAETLERNKDVADIYRDCEDVIHGSLQLLERYNRIRLSMRSGRRQGFSGGVLG